MQQKFQSVLQHHHGSELGWNTISIPFDPAQVWPEQTRLRVKGSIRAAGSEAGKDVPFATSLFRKQNLGYFMLVTQKLQKAAGISRGCRLDLTLEPDLDGRAATPPPELAKLLRQDRAVKKWFEALPYSYRKFAADQISEPKSPEARVRRAEQWVERMMLTMEGEQVPPPLLLQAFRRQPLARAGWDAMTANQRRYALLSLFTCQSPEAQQKRLDRILADALGKASKSAGGRKPTATDCEHIL